ncbi:MAG: glyceraldehyde 3-phosphate dehydrogenase NAD-binding domain-containing protein, partial [Salegentibacter sp.]
MAAPVKIGINGFGRIGRNLFRLLTDHPDIEVVAINDLADAHTLAHLLKYDSIHGVLPAKVSSTETEIVVNGHSTPVFNFSHPQEIPWSDHEVKIVVEATGKFKKVHDLRYHVRGHVEKVILSVPPEEESIKMVVLGVNEHILDGHEK